MKRANATSLISKTAKLQIQSLLFGLLSLLAVNLLSSTCANGQITPLGDAYTNSAKPTQNNGSATTLDVDGATEITYIQFNLGSIPSGASVSEATLKLYVNSVTSGGSFNVDYVTSAWAENTIDFSNAPPLGAAIASNVNVTTAEKNQYILINVTSALQAWLSGSETNNGLALVANGSFNATFDSKENTTTSHAPELDVVFEGGGGGTITGVLTGAGSGLTGGGTSGTLNLSLIETCSSGQTLSWNGSAWGCSSAGTGTITGVTPGTGLSGGGTSGNVTLNNTGILSLTSGTGITVGTGQNPGVAINTAVVPQLASPNTFTGNQTVNGNVSATGVVTGSAFQIGSNLFGFGNVNNENAFMGFGGNTTMTGTNNTASGWAALYNNTTGSNSTAAGVGALYSNTTGSSNTAFGSGALNNNSTGSANTATGYLALIANVASNNTATGYQALSFNETGTYNTATGGEALYGNISGVDNEASGYQALFYNNGSGNTAEGTSALVSNTSGNFNTAVGFASLLSNSTGSGNTAAGGSAGLTGDGSGLTGSNNTFLGSNAGLSTGTLTNATAIGANAQVWQSNAMVLGSTNGVNGATSDTYVAIADSTPTNIFTIGQGHGKALADGWSTYSSRRWKTNIQTLPDALAKVEKLRGVTYDLKENGQHEIGVIAEEVGAVVPEIVTYEANGKDARSVDYSRLTALLIEAVKAQQKQIAQQKNAITVLRTQLKERAAKDAALETRLAKLEKSTDKASTQLASAKIAPAAPRR